MPQYNLKEVKKAAEAHRVEYRGRKVQRDIANLGYEFEDVVECLMRLSKRCFYKTYHYDNNQPPDDAYRYFNSRPGELGKKPDELYIKFCLLDGTLIIDLGSFHLSC